MNDWYTLTFFDHHSFASPTRSTPHCLHPRRFPVQWKNLTFPCTRPWWKLFQMYNCPHPLDNTKEREQLCNQSLVPK